MKLLIDAGYSWRQVFLACAGTLAALLVMNILFLRESPASIGEPEPEADPDNLFGGRGGDPVASSIRSLLSPLFRRRVFWWACLLSLGLTLLRETFNTWIPTYFTESLSMSPGEAADKSALFPFFGGISVLLAGFLSDRLGRVSRALIMVVCLMLAAIALGVLAFSDFGGSKLWPVVVVTSIGFLLIGPYSYLSGAISLDFGGKQGALNGVRVYRRPRLSWRHARR